MSESQTVRDLTRARDKIAQHWIQGAEVVPLGGGEGGYCSVGALRFSILEEYGLTRREAAPQHLFNRCDHDAEVVELAINELYPELEGNYDLIDFNDYSGRTQAEFFEVFDRAIKIAERDDL
jgi:hypothetical protein